MLLTKAGRSLALESWHVLCVFCFPHGCVVGK